MNDVNYDLSVGTNWTMDMLSVGILLLGDHRARAWRTDSNMFSTASLPRRVSRLLPLFFNYSRFRKHLNNTTGVMHIEYNGWWGSSKCIVEAPIDDIEKHFWEIIGIATRERTLILNIFPITTKANTANNWNMRQHLFNVMNQASLKHNYKSHKCFAVVQLRGKIVSLITDGSF